MHAYNLINTGSKDRVIRLEREDLLVNGERSRLPQPQTAQRRSPENCVVTKTVTNEKNEVNHPLLNSPNQLDYRDIIAYREEGGGRLPEKEHLPVHGSPTTKKTAVFFPAVTAAERRGLAGDEIGTGGWNSSPENNWSSFSFSVVATSDSAQVVWLLEQDVGKPRKGRWRAVGLSPENTQHERERERDRRSSRLARRDECEESGGWSRLSKEEEAGW